jgi:hypothetical protein
VKQNTGQVLIPPDVTTKNLIRRTFTTDVAGSGSASCTILNDDDMCSAIPTDVAVNPVIAVTVNGAELMVPRGATVGNLIRLPREQQPAVLERLAVYRPWNGRLVPVTFDRTDPGILGVILKGGEVISWQRFLMGIK